MIIMSALAHRASGERSNVLKRGGFGGSGGNDNRVFHGVVLFECLDELRNSRTLLANGNVDAVELFGLIIAIVPSSLIQHGIQCDGSLASLTVADDKFTLTPADRNHCIDGLETCLDRLIDRAAR